MGGFAADLHIHSRFSRATSKGLNVRSLAAWAEVKGIGVLGTGDITHPGWLEEIARELEDDGSGLFTLREKSGLELFTPGLSGRLSGQARFMLQGEISSIYKRGGKVRKVHNLVYLPGIEAAKKLNAKLAQVGNLAADGRPILGLDSRNLLEMVLETHPEAFLIPAHIWTPWFSLFGSMSGFDSVEECYGDLSAHVFAMETGLSSDPGMNWTLSALDRYRMVSNSDAHSGEKLGREANLFRGERSYSGILRALRAHLPGAEESPCEFLGTVEFFPEEGKYHLDGHRKCNWSMQPAETLAHKGLCPVCGRPATLGVLHRVLALADRAEPAQPSGQPGYRSMIPLREVLSELLDTGAASKAVTAEYFRLIERIGPELFILNDAPLADIGRASPILADAVERMRQGRVLRCSGYDGEYGVITVFTPEERAQMRQGRMLAGLPARRGRKPAQNAAPRQSDPGSGPADDPEPAAPIQPEAPRGLNAAQQAAVSAGLGPEAPGPVLVLAGPGTGKTHTLLARVLRLLESGAEPKSLAIVTFTRRAAEELHERLLARLGEKAELPAADTLHALALDLWTAQKGQPPVLLSEDAARRMFLEALNDPEEAAATPLARREGLDLFRRCTLAREALAPLSASLPAPLAARAACAQARMAAEKALRNQADFTDLLEFLLALVSAPGFVPPFAHVLVDEVQDLSALQLEAVLGLAGSPARTPAGDADTPACPPPACPGRGFFAIGDPDQSIYGFRGAAGHVLERLHARWPGLRVLPLSENYRSGQGILDAASAVLPRCTPVVAPVNTPADASGVVPVDASGGQGARPLGTPVGEGLPSTAASPLSPARGGACPSLATAGSAAPGSPEGERPLAGSRGGAPCGGPGAAPPSSSPPARPRLLALPGRAWDLEFVEAPDERREARLVAERVQKLIGGASLTLVDETACLAPGDVAVLVRFRGLMAPYRAALEQAGVPVSAPETEVFWEEPRAAAILRVAGRLFGLPGQDHGDSEASEDMEADLPEFLLLQGPRVLPAALRETPPFDRHFWDGPAFRDLCQAFDEHGGWVGLLDWVRLETDFAAIRQVSQKVRVLTMHAAKGLEFEAVFLPALEAGILPFEGFGGGAKGGQDGGGLPDEDLAEERRLFYVAMTRAKSRLCLSCAASRTLYGATRQGRPSPFLADIPAELLRRTVLARKVQTKETQIRLF